MRALQDGLALPLVLKLAGCRCTGLFLHDTTPGRQKIPPVCFYFCSLGGFSFLFFYFFALESERKKETKCKCRLLALALAIDAACYRPEENPRQPVTKPPTHTHKGLLSRFRKSLIWHTGAALSHPNTRTKNSILGRFGEHRIHEPPPRCPDAAQRAPFSTATTVQEFQPCYCSLVVNILGKFLSGSGNF